MEDYDPKTAGEINMEMALKIIHRVINLENVSKEYIKRTEKPDYIAQREIINETLFDCNDTWKALRVFTMTYCAEGYLQNQKACGPTIDWMEELSKNCVGLVNFRNAHIPVPYYVKFLEWWNKVPYYWRPPSQFD
eukprot:Platyproteum_vivax@DN16784_c0_g1_i1.p1